MSQTSTTLNNKTCEVTVQSMLQQELWGDVNVYSHEHMGKSGAYCNAVSKQ